MRIVHMTSVHPWDDNRIFNKMCRALAKMDHEVHLVSFMNSDQDGQMVDGVTLHAINKPSNRRERFMKTTPAVLRKARLIQGDLYHFHDPEFLPYMTKFRAQVKKPVVYDAHEDYPAAILSKGWIPKLCRPSVSRAVDLFERRRVMNIDGVIVAWPKIMERFSKHPHKILINNYPYQDELHSTDITETERNSGLFVYVGGLSSIRGILEMIKAVEMGRGKFRLILGGNWISEVYKDKCQTEPGWQYCEYKGYVDRNEMRKLYARARAGLIAFFPEPNHIYSIPNKIFEYMSAGLPMIASDLPIQKSIVEDVGCGLIADARSPEEIYKKMCWLFEHPDSAGKMGRAGQKAVKEKYNWEQEVQKLIAFYNTIL